MSHGFQLEQWNNGEQNRCISPGLNAFTNQPLRRAMLFSVVVLAASATVWAVDDIPAPAFAHPRVVIQIRPPECSFLIDGDDCPRFEECCRKTCPEIYQTSNVEVWCEKFQYSRKTSVGCICIKEGPQRGFYFMTHKFFHVIQAKLGCEGPMRWDFYLASEVLLRIYDACTLLIPKSYHIIRLDLFTSELKRYSNLQCLYSLLNKIRYNFSTEPRPLRPVRRRPDRVSGTFRFFLLERRACF